VRKSLAVLAAALAVSFTATAGQAAPGMPVGFYDEAYTLFTPDPTGFDVLSELGADVLRLNVYWDRVAKSRPANGADPNDPAYDWSLYDRAVERAQERGIKLVLSIIATPRWANGGKGEDYAPSNLSDLQRFSTAAAKRYSYVNWWMAWNEPNAPNFLKPQSVRVGGQWVFRSPQIYAGLCNAIVDGVNAARSSNTVACGVTNPRGKTEPNGRRDAVSPILFLQEMKRYGADPEVIAHHAYPWTPFIKPGQRVKSKSAVTLGNINVLISTVNRLFGRQTPIWITEYGYQTDPPDKSFGVAWRTQAKYLREAVRIARKNPRIQMFLWFLIKDEPNVSGWQSGVIASDGEHKPSYAAFQGVARG
jgi:Cellulase (glycosyl hydrolase family 5)